MAIIKATNIYKYLKSKFSNTASHIKMNGTQSAGTSDLIARADHIHPSDTSRAPSSHNHGNISNDGKVGSAANVPLITGSNGIVQAGNFGTAANTFCQGNDSRLSNSRNPLFNDIAPSASATKDLNNYTTGGFYYINNDNLAPYISNCPLSGTNNKSFFLLVETWGASSTNYVKQTLTYYNSNDTYIRTKKSNSWNAWRKVSEVSFAQTKTSGIEIGTITINGVATKIYQQDNNTTYGAGTGLSLSSNAFSVKYGSAAGTACQGNDSRLSNARTPTSHTHGNLQNNGQVGVTAQANKNVVTDANGIITTENKIPAPTTTTLSFVNPNSMSGTVRVTEKNGWAVVYYENVKCTSTTGTGYTEFCKLPHAEGSERIFANINYSQQDNAIIFRVEGGYLKGRVIKANQLEFGSITYPLAGNN